MVQDAGGHRRRRQAAWGETKNHSGKIDTAESLEKEFGN